MGKKELQSIHEFVDRETLISIYNALVRHHFDYCSEMLDTLDIFALISTPLQKLQGGAARIIMDMKMILQH